MEIGNVTYALPLASIETHHISPKMALCIYLFIYFSYAFSPLASNSQYNHLEAVHYVNSTAAVHGSPAG